MLTVCRAVLLNRAGKDVFEIVAFGVGLGGPGGGRRGLALLARRLKSQLHGRQHGFFLFFDYLHFGHVRLSLAPRKRGSGNEIIMKIDDSVIPAEYYPVIEEGIAEAMMNGALNGYPVIDVEATITGGSFRESDSSAQGYKIAASTAFRDGCSIADPLMLEPIMMVDIITPSEFMGDVIGDINARRGEIQSVNPKGTVSEIKAKVPLKAMFGYSTDLRSSTQGRAVFSMNFSEYNKV